MQLNLACFGFMLQDFYPQRIYEQFQLGPPEWTCYRPINSLMALTNGRTMPRAVFGVEIEFDDAECGTHELQVNISSTKGEVIGFSAPIEVKPLPNYSFGVSCKTFLWETFP